MDFLRDPIWQFLGVVVAVVLFLVPILYQRLKRRTSQDSNSAKLDLPRILSVYSRPEYLYKMLKKDPKNVKKIKNPASVAEHKPEVLTDVEQDSSIIQRVFDEVGKPVLLRSLNNATKSDLASALRDGWDVVHFDCVVGPQGQLYLDDGEISPQTLREILVHKNIGLLVLMDCDSFKVVASANSAGVNALIAVTGSLPVLAAEKFVYGLYKGLALKYTVADALADARAITSVELMDNWDLTLFVLDGDSAFRINNAG